VTKKHAHQLMVKRGAHGAVRSSKDNANSGWCCEFSVDPFQVFSTAEETKVRPVIERLVQLIPEVESTLELSIPKPEIRMVVLQDKTEYDAYLAKHFPQLPKRRALYIQHRGPGLILTYTHDDWLTDARHECTHALLHLTHSKLPSWLDEGLAEYFEHESTDRTWHPEHRNAVAAQLRYGQVPTIDELEQWHITESLEAKQYRDAWSAVAFLLHHNEASRLALIRYLGDLESGAAAGYLGRRLPLKERQDWRENFLQFYAKNHRTGFSLLEAKR
jgi:hypothetical protein